MRWRRREATENPNESLILAEVASQCGWLVVGRQVEGPSEVAVRVSTDDGCGASSSAHVALDFWLRKDDPDAAIIRDCAVGNGNSGPERVAMAVALWKSITLPTLLELLAQDGCFADHYPSQDPDGLPGWHCIHGPWMGWGTSKSHVDRLQGWALEHPVLPVLAPLLPLPLDRTSPNGVRVLFGSNGATDIAEVKVNGLIDEPASRALGDLDFPREDQGTNLCRAFILATRPADT